MKIEKCIRLLVQNVKKKLKFLSNQMELALYIVGTVLESVETIDFKINYK
jgi:hypothetical protein